MTEEARRARFVPRRISMRGALPDCPMTVGAAAPITADARGTPPTRRSIRQTLA
jgi:hypothetical protein